LVPLVVVFFFFFVFFFFSSFFFYGALSRFRAMASSLPGFRDSFYEIRLLALITTPNQEGQGNSFRPAPLSKPV
jgi:hypothetical protein